MMDDRGGACRSSVLLCPPSQHLYQKKAWDACLPTCVSSSVSSVSLLSSLCCFASLKMIFVSTEASCPQASVSVSSVCYSLFLLFRVVKPISFPLCLGDICPRVHHLRRRLPHGFQCSLMKSNWSTRYQQNQESDSQRIAPLILDLQDCPQDRLTLPFWKLAGLVRSP